MLAFHDRQSCLVETVTIPPVPPMPDDSNFRAEIEAGPGVLRLSGNCRAADLAVLEAALASWRRGGARVLDLTAAGQLDIGAAWLLKQAVIQDAPAGDPRAGNPRCGPDAFPLPRRTSPGRGSGPPGRVAAAVAAVAGPFWPCARGAVPQLVPGPHLWRRADRHGRCRLAHAQAVARRLGRAPRLRDRLPGRARRRGHRLPDQRDFRLHRRTAAATVRCRDLSRSTSSHSACCANSVSC